MKPLIFILAIVIFYTTVSAQNDASEEKIPFQTKNKDACVMTVSGQGEVKVKIECMKLAKKYSCDFVGKPSYCRAHNKNPKAFWQQLSLDLQEKSNACESQVIRHSMCPKAPSQSLLKQTDGSGNPEQSDTAKPQKKPPPTKTSTTKKPTTKRPATTKSSNQDPPNAKAMKMAKERCWEYFQIFCGYVIEIFVS
ncbi:fibroblast growth factor-binding protein 2 [Bombina bombina]|uniref:fibroblast growth factor-binding protein 2 n=1 Tax=Bombina bombina TaxID=8345 RepID=UPI00235AC4D4|nr:fibroblast growth factor-binding protein 2 [Bombina bombina]